MNHYSLTHVPDPVLLRDLRSLLARERATTAELLAHLAEVDARKLYVPAAHPSMFSYCAHELHMSEDAAYKRIQAARTAWRFPAIFPALADGQLNLTGVLLLGPYLNPANADELLGAAAGKTKSEIEEWLAQRFPRSELLPLVTALPAALPPDGQLAPERVKLDGTELAPGQIESDDFDADGQLAPGRVAASATPARLTPAAPGRYSLQLTIGKGTHDKLRHAQALLGHQIPSGEVAEVLDRALDALIGQLEQRKFAATDRPRPRQKRPSATPRHVPAEVRRTVWERDGGQCTFVSAAGHRCPARTRLEFDHVEPVARGGRSTVKGVRLRCRTHNQYAAECAFGAGFMSRKREAARRAVEETCARAATEAEEARARAAAVAEVVPWLHALGLRMDEARRAAARCEMAVDAPLEERVRHALRCSGRPSRRYATRTPQPVP